MSSEFLVILVLAAALVLLAVGLALRHFRRRTGGPIAALRAIAIERMQDILLPDGMGGQIHIEQLVLTRSGVVVFDVKPYSGTVFASDRMDEWTVMGPAGRFVFPNPQATLLDRVAAVKELIRGMPVEGYVLFGDNADFSKGKPAYVLRAGELAERFEKPAAAQCEQLVNAYSPHWRKLEAAALKGVSRSAA